MTTVNPAIVENSRAAKVPEYNFQSKACGYCKQTRSKAQYKLHPDFCTQCVKRGNTVRLPRQGES